LTNHRPNAVFTTVGDHDPEVALARARSERASSKSVAGDGETHDMRTWFAATLTHRRTRCGWATARSRHLDRDGQLDLEFEEAFDEAGSRREPPPTPPAATGRANAGRRGTGTGVVLASCQVPVLVKRVASWEHRGRGSGH